MVTLLKTHKCSLEPGKTLVKVVFLLCSRKSTPHSWYDYCHFASRVPLAISAFSLLGLYSEAHGILGPAGADIHFDPVVPSIPGNKCFIECHDHSFLLNIAFR